ncbi:MAG: TIM barrel protein [Bacteroidales bacterium]
MNIISRRSFIEKSVALGAAGLIAPSALNLSSAEARPRVLKNNISLAQWALVGEIRAGEWTNLDFPRIAREVFDIDGIEFVNTLWGVPTMNYLNQLKRNADNYGVTMVLIMCDAEGDGCSPTRKERRQFEINHRKWIDAAQFLGCHAIRTNCVGPRDREVNKEEALKWAAESYNMLLEYAVPANISVLIENHGGVSNDPDWMAALMKEVNSLYFGTLPDWRGPGGEYDNYEYLQKTLPWAGGMSYRNQPTEELTAKMIKLAMDSGYSGWYGIESSGREEIKKGKELLNKYLLNI